MMIDSFYWISVFFSLNIVCFFSSFFFFFSPLFLSSSHFIAEVALRGDRDTPSWCRWWQPKQMTVNCIVCISSCDVCFTCGRLLMQIQMNRWWWSAPPFNNSQEFIFGFFEIFRYTISYNSYRIISRILNWRWMVFFFSFILSDTFRFYQLFRLELLQFKSLKIRDDSLYRILSTCFKFLSILWRCCCYLSRSFWKYFWNYQYNEYLIPVILIQLMHIRWQLPRLLSLLSLLLPLYLSYLP